MGTTKIESYTERQNDIAVIIKAMGHPARIAIIEFLLNHSTCICNDIVGELPLAQATVSQHLKELKNAGIIKGTIEGKSICYCLDTVVFEKIKNYFEEINTKLLTKNTQCC